MIVSNTSLRASFRFMKVLENAILRPWHPLAVDMNFDCPSDKTFVYHVQGNEKIKIYRKRLTF